MAGRARWTDERVERELAAFLAAYDEWPAYREWRAARRKRLHAEALARRSAREWAEHFNVVFVERAPGRPAWDEPRIRRELAVALRAMAPLEVWPRREALRAVAGHGL